MQISTRVIYVVFFFFSLSLQTTAQNQITLEEIWGGAFRTEGLDALRSLKNGKEYVVLNYDRAQRASTIDVYSYQTGEKVRTLVNSANLNEVPYILSYTFSADEQKILLATELEPVYRHSRLGTYFVYDLNSKTLNRLYSEKVQEPTFSPDGTQIAFGFENNLYIKSLSSGNVEQITSDGKKNEIINGITDWVYEEEFAFVRAFEWNKTGSHIAYIRFDETQVPEFAMDVYGKALYPKSQVFKYPKAGETNASVSLHLYNVSEKQTKPVNLSAYNSYYIPRIKWTQDASLLSVQLANRHQNILDLVFVDANTASTQKIHQEKDAAYVDVTDDLTFLPDNSFIWTSERDGWNHIYHYDAQGKLKNQLTSGAWEVTRYYGYDAKRKRIFYQSSETHSTQRDVYSVGLNGKKKMRLTTGDGTHSASFSTDFTYFINTFSSTTTPYRYTLHWAKDGKQARAIKNNTKLLEKLEGYTLSPKEFTTLEVNGETLNAYFIKPANFDPSKKYPLFLYQYSGPGSQQVANRWHGTNDYWHQMLAQNNIIIACVDGRGTGLKGRDFKKVTQLELGKYEVEDQIAVAQQLGKYNYIDANRIGIWGWSYGGFMASNCLFQGADTFSMAIAVAPVTSWRFYDTIYTERYMQTPQENASGYDENSPLSHVNKLKGKFLLVHGSADDNVHVQNTTRLVEALVQANKEFDWRIYPDKNHGIYGGNTRLHLYTLMTEFIKENL